MPHAMKCVPTVVNYAITRGIGCKEPTPHEVKGGGVRKLGFLKFYSQKNAGLLELR